jgi:hypothetical protein
LVIAFRRASLHRVVKSATSRARIVAGCRISVMESVISEQLARIYCQGFRLSRRALCELWVWRLCGIVLVLISWRTARVRNQ